MNAENYELEISEVLREKDKYEKERAALRRRMKQINHRIIELQAGYVAIRHRKSYVLRLSQEITRIIFLYTQKYRGNNTSIFEPLSESGLLPEVVVSHVCREWRLISLAYPLLWTRFLYDGYKATRVPLDRFEVYLQRSQLKLLELWFNFKGVNHDKIDCEDHLDLLEAAVSHVKRWKGITVISDINTPLLSAPSMLEWASAPNLEYFAFCTYAEDGYAESLEPTIFKNGAPKLKSVILDSSTGLGLLPPLYNVTTLCLEFPDDGMDPEIEDPFPWSTFVEVLSLPSLINLSIAGQIFEEPDSFVSMNPIIMDNLEHLRCSETNSNFPFILPFLKAPSLETLIIKSESLEDLGDNQPEPLGFPCLKSLSLIETPITSPAARYFAKMTGSVTDITIIDKKYDESIFSVFLHSSSEYWSNLRAVTLDLDIGGRLNDVISFVQTRRNSGLVLHVPEHIVSQWQSILFLGQPHAYAELAQACHIQTTDFNSKIVSPVWQELWPSDEDDEDEDDDDDNEEDHDSSDT